MKDIPEYLLKKYHDISWEKLNVQNLVLVKNTAKIVFLLNFIFLIVDYINFIRGYWTRNPSYRLLFLTHIFLGVSLLAYVLSSKRNQDNAKKNTIYTQTFIFTLLNLAAFISGRVDAFLNGEITVFVFACFYFSFFFYQKPLYAILSNAEALAVFITLEIFTQTNVDTLQSDIGNAAIVVILSCFIQIKISRTMLGYNIYKFNLEDILGERTDELKNSMAQIQRLDRLNIVGELSSIVTHEIRNPLTTVRGFLQLLRKKQKDTMDIEYFDLMIGEIDRTNEIIEEFLSISRKKTAVMSVGNISNVVKSIVPLIEADVVNRKMNLKVDIQDVPDTYINQQELVQMVLNLTRNGLDAMAADGTLTLKVCAKDSDIILSVKDEGTGIPDEVLDKLGTPFFTTKDMGNGLGLVTCNSIIKRHNGELNIETGPHGSTFEIRFKPIEDKEVLFALYEQQVL